MRGVTMDITAAVEAEIERAELLERESQAREEAEEASRLKEEFLATVSHELRTPLNAVVGWSRLVRSGQLDKEGMMHALEVIERNASAQRQIIEDLLDVSRIVTGKLRINTQRVDLLLVIHAAIDAVRPAAEAKEIDLHTHFEAPDALVRADVERLQQVLWNLLANAVKFTPQRGTVDIFLRLHGSLAEIRIEDSGPGIPAEFLPRIFERFSQADGSSTRKHGGLGLGLAIVRHLVELHGGTALADSAGDNQGAKFTIRLPAMIANEHPLPEELKQPALVEVETRDRKPSSLQGLRVLVVDDEIDARTLLTMMLERCGAKVVAVGSSSEGLESIESWLPDVLIADIGMPVEDGYGMIKKIRRLPKKKGGQTPALALTAYARTEDRVRALSEGYQVHLAKPVDRYELAAVIASLGRR